MRSTPSPAPSLAATVDHAGLASPSSAASVRPQASAAAQPVTRSNAGLAQTMRPCASSSASRSELSRASARHALSGAATSAEGEAAGLGMARAGWFSSIAAWHTVPPAEPRRALSVCDLQHELAEVLAVEKLQQRLG